MSRLTTTCLKVLLTPIAFWQARGGGEVEHSAPSALESPVPAERLERIAMYARAGYFHMSYTVDMMTMTGEIPPE